MLELPVLQGPASLWRSLPPDRRRLAAIVLAAAYLLPLGTLQIVAARPILESESRGFHDNGPLAYLVLFAGIALLLLAWRAPFLSLMLMGVLFTVMTVLHLYDVSAEAILVDVATFLVAARGRRRELFAAVVVCLVIDVAHSTPWRIPPAVLGYNVAFYVAAFAAGIASFRSREVLARLVAARQALAEQRAREVAQAVVVERSTIAGDLQPFVLAGVRDMTSRARRVKRAVLAGRTVDAAEVQQIEQAGRACLGDLRRVLTVLSTAVHEAAAPPPVSTDPPARPERRRGSAVLSGWPADVAVTALLCALALYEQFTLGGGVHGPLSTQRAVALTVAPVLPLLLRRRLPLLAPVLTLAALSYLYATAPSYEFVSGFVTVFILAYSAAVHAGPRGAAVGLVVAVGQLLGSYFGSEQFDKRFAVGILAPLIVQSIFAAAAGLLVRRQRALAQEVREANELLALGRDKELAAAVVLERLQVARDMHDVVGHGITVMVVQSGAARALLHRDPGRAVEALREVERGGRVALEELGSLTAPGAIADAPCALAKDDIIDLVKRTAGGAVSVDLSFAGRSRPVSGPASVALHRVLVESLTNAMKYGDGRAQVKVSYATSGVEVVVDNALGSRAATDGPTEMSGGLGMLGMRERLHLLGGALQVKTTGGRFCLTAGLPWPSQP